MPVCKREPVRSGCHLTNLLPYLSDPNHPSHAEYDVRRGRAYEHLSPEEFIARTFRDIERHNRSKIGHSGRKVENCAHFFICRFPDSSFLDKTEEDEYELEMVLCLAPDMTVLCYRHANWETGSIDFNFVVPTLVGDPLRTRYGADRNIRSEMIRLSDRLTDNFNARRRLLGRPAIFTMRESKKNLAREKQRELIEREVAEAATAESLDLERLLFILRKLGHEVKKCSNDGNTVSIVPRGKKQAVRITLDTLLDAPLMALRRAQVIEDVSNEGGSAERFELKKDYERLLVLGLQPKQRSLDR